MTPIGESCFVQIKTNSRGTSGIRLKLSNALEFALSKNPCFLILLTYDDTSSLTAVYALHFWQNEIARTLKKARKLDAQGRIDLHKFTLHFGIADMLCIPSTDVISTLLSIVDSFGPHYSDRKRLISDGVGFEKVMLSGSISFQDETSIDDILDVQIGLRDMLEVSHFSMRSNRFGISAREPLINVNSGAAFMRSHPIDCRLDVSSKTVRVTLSGQLFVPAIPSLAKDKMRFRIVAPFIECVYRETDKNFQFTAKWTAEEQNKLSDLLVIFDLMHIFSSGEVDFFLYVDGKPALGAKGPTQAFEILPNIITIEKFIRFLVANAAPFDIAENFSLSLAGLMQIIEAIDIHNSLVMLPTLEATCEIQWNNDPYTGPIYATYFVPTCVNNFVIYTIVRRKADIFPQGGKMMKIVFGEAEFTHIKVLPGSRETTDKIVERELEAKSQEYSDYPILFLSDLKSFTQDSNASNPN